MYPRSCLPRYVPQVMPQPTFSQLQCCHPQLQPLHKGSVRNFTDVKLAVPHKVEISQTFSTPIVRQNKSRGLQAPNVQIYTQCNHCSSTTPSPAPIHSTYRACWCLHCGFFSVITGSASSVQNFWRKRCLYTGVTHTGVRIKKKKCFYLAAQPAQWCDL